MATLPEGFAALASGYAPEIGALAARLVDVIASGHPELSTKILSGWQAVGFRHAEAGHVCGVFLQRGRVMLVFEHGRLLSDPEGILCGDTKQTRYIPFAPGDEIPEGAIIAYVSEAIALRL
jgi:hypothetical protein